jgi:WD40 repeat protein
VSGLLEDAYNTVREYFIPISANALQVYHSVLVFMPDCKLYQRAFQDEISIARMTTTRESTWKQSIILEGHTSKVNCLALSSDSRWIVSCSDDCTARVWDISSGEPGTIFVHKSPITAAAFSPDGLNVALGDADGRICIWVIMTGLKAADFWYDSSKTLCLAYIKDGARVVSCSKTKISFTDISTRTLLGTVRLERRFSCAESLAMNTFLNGSRLCMHYMTYHGQTRIGFLEIWVIVDHIDIAHRINLGRTWASSGVAFSADGQRAAFMNEQGVLEVVEFLQDGDIIRSTLNTLGVLLTGHGEVLAISSLGRVSFAIGSLSLDVVHYDMSSGSLARPRSVTTLGQHTMSVTCMAFSPDDARVISGSKDGTIGIWEAKVQRTGPVSSQNLSSRPSVITTHFSPDGSRLICIFQDESLRNYSTDTGTVLSSLTREQWLAAPEASEADSLVCGLSSDAAVWKNEFCFGTLGPWMLVNQEVVQTYAPFNLASSWPHLSFCLSISPDSRRLAFFHKQAGRCLYIWDLQAQSVVACSETIPDPRYNITPVWSPDGLVCVVMVKGNKLHACDAMTGRLLASRNFPSFSRRDEIGTELHAEFSADGQHLLFILRDFLQQHVFIWSTDPDSDSTSPVPIIRLSGSQRFLRTECRW